MSLLALFFVSLSCLLAAYLLGMAVWAGVWLCGRFRLGRGRDWGDVAVWLMVLTGVAGYGTAAVLRYLHYRTPMWDLAIYTQMAWSWWRYGVSFSTIHKATQFGIHIAPSQLLPATLSMAFPTAPMLQVLSVLGLCLGALPLAWLAREWFASPWVRVAVVGGYLLQPAVSMGSNDYQPEFIACFFLALAAYAFHLRRYRLLCVSLALAVLTKEALALVAVGYGLALLRERATRRLGAGLVVGGLGWLVVCVKLLIPWFSGEEYLHIALRYSALGGSLGEVAWTALTRPWVFFGEAVQQHDFEYLLGWVWLGGWLYWLSPSFWLLALPHLAQSVLATEYVLRMHNLHYQVPLLPILLAASLDGWRRVTLWLGEGRGGWSSSAVRSVPQRMVGAFLAGPLLYGWLWAPALWYYQNDFGMYWQPERRAAGERMLAEVARRVPHDAWLSAPRGMSARLAERPRLSHWPHYLRHDWVLLDLENMYAVDDPAAFWDNLVSLEEGFALEVQDGPFFLLRRAGPEEAQASPGWLAGLIRERLPSLHRSGLTSYSPPEVSPYLATPQPEFGWKEAGSVRLPNFTWEQVDGAKEYQVQVKLALDQELRVIAVTGQTSWAALHWASMPAQGGDSVRLRSVGRDGLVSAWSEEFPFPRKDAAPESTEAWLQRVAGVRPPDAEVPR